MAVVFHVRGDSKDARFSSSGKTPASLAAVAANNPSITTSAITGVIGGSVIDMDSGAASINYLEYLGRNNTPAKAFTANLRVAFPGTTGLLGLWGWGSGATSYFSRLAFYYSSGTLNLRWFDAQVNTRLSLTMNWTPTANKIYDLGVQWDGSASTGAARIYIDSVLQTSGASSVARPTDDRPNVNVLDLGASTFDIANTRILVNEFTIWDTADVNFASVTLTSGLGALNGDARTAFVDAASFDGTVSTDPGASNVLSATGYTIAGVSYTGSYSPPVSTNPGAANVLSGTGYTINGTSYTGSLVYGTNTDPGVGNVRLGTSYAIQGVALTGTLSVPTAVSGTASTCDTNTIKETLRYILDQANTTTASVDLSSNLARRVQTIMKINPEKLRPQASLFPCVTVFLSNKSIEQKSIAGNQVAGKRKANLTFSIVGMTWNDRTQDYRKDPADDDLEYLMENIELILRSYADLNRNCLWQFPTGVSYHSAGYDEQTHFRIGIIDLQVTVYY